MDDLERLLPSADVKPSLWGQRYRTWEGLDRPTLMALLALVRERYLMGVARDYRHHHPGEDEAAIAAHVLVLKEIREHTLALLAKVPDELFTVVPDGETWSCHDLVNHLAADEHGEFHPGPPDTLFHRIGTDMVHLRQLRRFLHALDVERYPNPPGAAGPSGGAV